MISKKSKALTTCEEAMGRTLANLIMLSIKFDSSFVLMAPDVYLSLVLGDLLMMT